MSTKFLWTGLTFLIVLGTLGWSKGFILVGVIIMIFGVVLMWLDK